MDETVIYILRKNEKVVLETCCRRNFLKALEQRTRQFTKEDVESFRYIFTMVASPDTRLRLKNNYSLEVLRPYTYRRECLVRHHQELQMKRMAERNKWFMKELFN